MADYPEWPERWEFFDGILKYCPEDSEDLGGETDIEGIPFMNAMWIVAHPDPEPPKRHKKKRKKKRGTKKRKRSNAAR